MANPIEQLHAVGQSTWLDSISRELLVSGELKSMVQQDLIRGVTSNPSIFQKAITGAEEYKQQLSELSGNGLSGYEAFLAIGGDDIRNAADVLRPLYDSLDGADGFVSFEAQAGGTYAMIDEAKRMWALVGRSNLMIKVPGVPEGVAAVEELIADGINVNITLLFSVAVYEQYAEAYIKGLERRLAAGQDVHSIASVASFFVSRVDTKVDAKLPEGSPLRGKLAVANARKAYRSFLRIFSGDRWQRLANAGARVQRPLWASTSTKNPAYSDVLYVTDLVAPDTVNTLPETTLKAFADHGVIGPAIMEGLDDADRVLAEAAVAGIDLEKIADELLIEGLKAFSDDFEKLLDEIEKAVATPDGVAATALEEVDHEDVLNRIWREDHTLWSDDPTEITQPNRLGWLTVAEMMVDRLDDLDKFVAGVRADGLTTAVLLGMGGSSLAPEVMFTTFGANEGGLQLKVLDTTVPEDILAVERSIDLQKTLFIVSSKSGTTLETTSQLAYFWDKLPDGSHFVAVTDPGTPLAETGKQRGFRRVFLNPENIGGRYSVLSYFGLVPASLLGFDYKDMLGRAIDMQKSCEDIDKAFENAGILLGVELGSAALQGKDKLTVILPDEIASLGDWIEQLIAESTGKLGRGIIPIVCEDLGPPEVYGPDRIFVAIGDNEKLKPLEAAGHTVIRIPYSEKLQLGEEFYRWQFATAVAGHLLHINPFDQPNVQQAKDAADRRLKDTSPLPPTRSIVEQAQLIRPGDYIALLAYLPRTKENRERLQALRHKLRQRYHVATTVGFGPRYLHSTGQIHKGGPNNGVFFQLTQEPGEDAAIPGQTYSFARLMQAQADGDLESLLGAGRRAVRTSLEMLEAL